MAEAVAAPPAARPPVGALRILAVVACAFLAYEAWTLIGWIAEGPREVTTGRIVGSGTWVTAKVVEAIVLLSVAGFVVHAVRERRRLGRLGTDGLLIVGMVSAAFWDPIYNWLTPAWLYSSNLVNVADWFSHAPGVVNAAAGETPWPIVIVLIGYPLWGVGFAILIAQGLSLIDARRGPASAVACGLWAWALGALITGVAYATFRALGLMTAPGYRVTFLGDDELLLLSLSGGFVFGALGLTRHLRDATGRTLVEQSDSPRVRLLGAIGLCQVVVVLGWGLLTVPFSLYAAPYPDVPDHLLTRVCDVGDVTGTAYGPCPGSPGFSLPLRGSAE